VSHVIDNAPSLSYAAHTARRFLEPQSQPRLNCRKIAIAVIDRATEMGQSAQKPRQPRVRQVPESKSLQQKKVSRPELHVFEQRRESFKTDFRYGKVPLPEY
jgi:hypothetical protein